MKLVKITILSMFIFLSCYVQAQYGGGEANPNLKTHPEAIKRFQNNRFGMFIHWGPVTLRGQEIGWSRNKSIPEEDYDKLYKEFNPILFNAEEWVKIAKEAGMKYMVLVTKHHDGFSLWDSQFTDYDMTATPYGKDVVKSLADECKKQGLDFGVYYSILDWWHPGYPVNKPKDGYNTPKGQKITNPKTAAQMNRYITYMKNQLKELIDDYDPTMIWFDGGWEWPWTHEMGMDLYAYLRGLKDDIIINNRIDKGLHGMVIKKFEKPEIFAGDYATPEQRIGEFNIDIPWETSMTIAKQWAWKANDKLKTKKECIQTLLKTVGGDGNFLFNVGPMADGRIEQRQIDRLKEIGDWLNTNGEAVYGTHGGPYLPSNRMVSTHKDNKIYLHLFNTENNHIQLPFVKGVKIKNAYFLDGKIPLDVYQNKESIKIGLPTSLPDTIASVIVLVLNKQAGDIDPIKRINY